MNPATTRSSDSEPNALTNGFSVEPTTIAATEPPAAIRPNSRFACRRSNRSAASSQNCSPMITMMMFIQT